MKILLLGSLISQEAMEQLNNGSRVKASAAPVNYETMLVKGLQENGAQVEALSVPAVAAWPGSIYKYMEGKKERLEFSTTVQWVPFVNIQGLKQWTIRRNVTKLLKNWLIVNQNEPDKVVLMYSIYPPYSVPAVKLCREYGCHLCAVIADLPEYMYTWKGHKGIRQWFARRLSNQMLALQGHCDSYVLFTRKMAQRMGIVHKPFIVSEGFCDASIYDDIPDCGKYAKKTVMYAGNLSKLYGIRNLVDGFMLTRGDYELHLYGAGADAAYIEECAAKDPRIRFFGRVPRQEILQAYKRAHLLVVNKPTEDDYSNYSFSSKILEMMGSGTPVLTTKVGGMPEAYYPYFYFIEDETISGVSRALSDTIRKNPCELNEMGIRAKAFAVSEKSYGSQSGKLTEFLHRLITKESKGQRSDE